MLRQSSVKAVLLFSMSLLLLVACGDEDDNNSSGGNIFASNSSTVNNSTTTTNNATTPVNNTTSTPNNMSTNNGGTSAMPPDCIPLNPTIEGDCEVLCQTGCADSQGCVLSQTEVTEPEPSTIFAAVCVESGTGGFEAECSADSDCQAGFGCLEPPEGGTAMVCLEYCRTGGPEAPKCSAGFECIGFRDEIRIGVCRPEPEGCSVYPDSCDNGDECYEVAEGPRVCAEPGVVQRDEACSAIGECDGGMRCVDVGGGEMQCKLLCDPANDDPDRFCLDGEFCNTQTDGSGQDLTWGACF